MDWVINWFGLPVLLFCFYKMFFFFIRRYDLEDEAGFFQILLHVITERGLVETAFFLIGTLTPTIFILVWFGHVLGSCS